MTTIRSFRSFIMGALQMGLCTRLKAIQLRGGVKRLLPVHSIKQAVLGWLVKK